MRIATWNVNGVRAREDYIQLWLESRQPDLVGFQEIKATEDVFPMEIFAELGYHVHVHGQKGFNGVALASKQEFEAVHRGLPGQEARGARLIACDSGDLTYATIYCPNGKYVEHKDYQMKLEWYKSLREYCEDQIQKGRQLIIGGDYNICAKAIDTHLGEKGDGEIFHTNEERAALNELFNLGLVDIYRARNPDSDAYSWWDYRAGAFQRNHGLRIDLLLATTSVLDRVDDVCIDRDFRKKKEGLTASDHAPVYIDLTT